MCTSNRAINGPSRLVRFVLSQQTSFRLQSEKLFNSRAVNSDWPLSGSELISISDFLIKYSDSASYFDSSALEERATSTYWIWSLVDSTTSLVVMLKKKSSCLCWKSNPRDPIYSLCWLSSLDPLTRVYGYIIMG